MPDDAAADEDVLIASRPPKGLRPGTRLARVIAGLDGVRVRYQVAMPEGGRNLAGSGRLQLERVNDTTGCRVLGEVFLPSGFEFCFHSFWLTRRGMIVLALGTATMADADAPPLTGNHIQPVEWHGDSVAAAKEWVEKTRKDREQRKAGVAPPSRGSP